MLTTLLAGCVTDRYADPIAVAMDKTEGHDARWAALEQAEKEMWDHPRRVELLQKMVWERGYPSSYSNYAVDQLVAIDEPAAKAFLDDAIVLVKDWETLQHILDTAVSRGWKDFVPAVVRSYAMRSQSIRDEDRPERKAIEALLPGVAMEEVVVGVFAESHELSVTRRVAAWALLCRLLEDEGKLVEVLRRVELHDPLLVDLKAGAVELGIVPSQMETVAWLQLLRTPEHRVFWSRAAGVVEGLGREQRRGLELRHLATLIYLADREPGVLRQGREELLSELGAWDASREHYTKGPTYDGPMDEHPQRFEHWKEGLAWADLATMKAMASILESERVTRAFFVHADEDNADSSTELGGLLQRDEAGDPYVHAYAPMARSHDLKYIPPKQLVLEGYTAIAHYHFHAQDHKNRRYAGPGLGDIDRIAQTQRFTGLVLTFIDRDTLNVDLFFAPDVVIDMGTIRRK